MPRTYGTTNFMPYAAAPAVGPVGDCYYNTASKTVYVSDGTNWNALQGATGGAGGGAPYAPVTGTAPPPAAPVITPPTGLLWVDLSTTPSWTPSAGPGVPPGGATGTYLQKRSATDYDTQWTAPSSLIYYQTISQLLSTNSPYPIPHNLGTRNVVVQMWDATTGNLIGAQVQVVNANTVQISVTQSAPNPVNVVVIGTPNLAPPINPSDIASKSYVDARTPNLPAPVTSGSGVQTFTDALGDVWVAANGVYSGAWKRARDVLHGSHYRVAAFNVGTAAGNLYCDTVINGDLFSWYASTGIWTCGVAGLYQHNFSLGAALTATTQILTCYMRNSGGSAISQTNLVGAASGISMAICQLSRYFNVGDQVQTVMSCTTAVTGRNAVDSTRYNWDYLGTG